MYKISEEIKRGMHATPEELGKQLEGLPDDITRCSRDCPFSVKIRILPSTLTHLSSKPLILRLGKRGITIAKILILMFPCLAKKVKKRLISKSWYHNAM